jgi:hypothetical protein
MARRGSLAGQQRATANGTSRSQRLSRPLSAIATYQRSKTTPCTVERPCLQRGFRAPFRMTAVRRSGSFFWRFDTSGKTPALLHHGRVTARRVRRPVDLRSAAARRSADFSERDGCPQRRRHSIRAPARPSRQLRTARRCAAAQASTPRRRGQDRWYCETAQPCGSGGRRPR